MQKAVVVLIIVMINLIFLKCCPVMAKQDETAVSSPPALSSSVKLKKFCNYPGWERKKCLKFCSNHS